MLVNVYITDFFCFYITSEFGWDWAITIGTIEASIFTIVVTGLFSMMVRCLGEEKIRNSSMFQNVGSHMQ